MTESIAGESKRLETEKYAEAYVRDFQRLSNLRRSPQSQVAPQKTLRLHDIITNGYALPHDAHYGTVAWPVLDTSMHESAAHYLPRLLVSMGHDHAYPADLIAILAGLSVNTCWNACLEGEDNAYALAASVVQYAEKHTGFSMARAAVPAVCKLLNGWLAPSIPWEKLPKPEDLCKHLFGEAWCHFNFPATSDTADRISRERPPFVPGVCPCQDGQSAAFGVEPLPGDLNGVP
jgi:hypothetical protein